jgi:hypothetical protein
MAELDREQYRWRRDKSPIVEKYREEHAKLMSAIAGRGFLLLPGYAYDAENSLEIILKRQLSNLNFEILSETITRELKQLGVDYDSSYKNEALIWEIEKQTLLSAWDQELAVIKQGMANNEETFNLLAIEVSKRAITLMEGKTEISLEAEAYRTILAELDGSTAPYEVQLANAKLLTAQKKLELIPILEEIIVKEQELLVIEQEKISAYTDYVTAEQALADKKQTLVPYIGEYSTIVEEYATKIENTQIPLEEQITQEKVTQANLSVTKMGHYIGELNIDVEKANRTLTLMDVKRELQETKFANDQELIETEIGLTEDYKEVKDTNFNTLLDEERGSFAQILTDKQTIRDIRGSAKVSQAASVAAAEIEANDDVSSSDAHRIRQVSEINAASNITSSLEHIIG